MAEPIIIGRVAVKVYPHTKDFRREAQRDLDRIERTLKEMGTKLRIDLDTEHLNRELERIQDRLDDLRGHVEVEIADPSYRHTQARLTILSRDRTVKIRPLLDNVATRKVGSALAALSGGRAIGNVLQDLGQWLGNLDKALPMIGSVTLAISALGAVGITSISNLAALSYSLAQIGAAALTLPGILGGVVIGLGATFAALKDFNKELPEVGKAFKDFQKLISGNFWDKAAKPMRGFFNDVLPRLREGLGLTGTALGDFFGKLSTSLKGKFNEALGGMFEDLGKSIDIAGKGTDGMATALRILGEVGAGYLPRLATWFVDVANGFATWLDEANKTGRLQEMIDAGITNLSALGRAGMDFLGILAGIGRAAASGGGSVLVMFADTMERVNKAVNTPAFQKGLARVFRAAHDAISDIVKFAGPGFEKFMRTIPGLAERTFGIAGRTIGKALGAIFDAFANPKFQDGIVALFEGIEAAVDGLAPVMPDVAEAFGVLGEVLGELMKVVGPSLGDIFGALADAFVAMGPSLKDTVNALGGSLRDAIKWLIPKLPAVTDVIIRLLDFVADHPDVMLALAAAFTALALALPGLSSLIGGVATAIGSISVGGVLGVAGGLAALVLAIAGFTMIPGDTIKDKLTTVKDAFDPVAESGERLRDAIDDLVRVTFPDLNGVIEANGANFDRWRENVRGAMDAFAAIIEFGVTFAEANIRAFTLIWETIWGTFGGTITGIVTGFMDAIGRIIRGGLDIITGIFRIATAFLRGDWSGMWENFKLVCKGAFEVVDGIIRAKLALIKGYFSAAKDVITGIAGQIWEGVKESFRLGIEAARRLVGELPGKLRSAFGDPRATLYGVGVAILTGLASGIADTLGSVLTTIRAVVATIIATAKAGLKVNSPSRVFRSIGNSVGEGLSMGIEDGKSASAKAAAELTSAAIKGASGVASKVQVASAAGAPSAAVGDGNTYNLNVDAGGSGASPDDIADALLFGIRKVTLGGRYA